MVKRIQSKRRIMRDFLIKEISAVDAPAQQHARMTLMKRADDVEKKYKSTSELPESVRNALPEAAQRQFMAVVNFALKGDASEESAFKQAWGALKNAGWHKGEDDKWVKKSSDTDEPLTAAEKQQLDALQKTVNDLAEQIDKTQARVPAGSSEGGQFASGDGIGGGGSGGGSWGTDDPKDWSSRRSHVVQRLEQSGYSASGKVKGGHRSGMRYQNYTSGEDKVRLFANGSWDKNGGKTTSNRGTYIQIGQAFQKDYGACSPSTMLHDVEALDFDAVLAANEAIEATYQVKDEVWRHWNALQRSFETIAADEDVAAADKVTAMRTSLDQFIASLADETREDVTKRITAVPVLAALLEKSEEGDEPMTAAEKQQLDELQKSVADLTAKLAAATAKEPAKKAAELQGELEKAQAQLAEITAKLEKADAEKTEAEALAKMSDDEKMYMEKMPVADRQAFMSLSAAERKKKMSKAADEDPVVYKSASSGEEFRKSDDPRLVKMAKQADEDRAIAKAEREKRETSELQKRATEDPIAKFAGETDAKVEVLRAIDKMDEAPRNDLLKMLEAGGKAISAAFEKIGHKAGELAKTDAAFEKKVAEIQDRDKVSKAVAMSKARVEDPAAFEAYQAAGSPSAN